MEKLIVLVSFICLIAIWYRDKRKRDAEFLNLEKYYKEKYRR